MPLLCKVGFIYGNGGLFPKLSEIDQNGLYRDCKVLIVACI